MTACSPHACENTMMRMPIIIGMTNGFLNNWPSDTSSNLIAS